MIIQDWISERIQYILQAPQMWGSLESVEAQILTLLEILKIPNDGKVLPSYREYLREKYPHKPSLPLFRLVGDEEDFIKVIKGFIERETQ